MAEEPPETATAEDAATNAAQPQSEIEQLRAQVRALEEWRDQTLAAQAQATSSGTAPAAATPAQASGGRGTGGVTVELYGSIQADAFYDVNRVDPTWVGAFRPSKIPTAEGVFGDDGQASFSARQTLIGISGSGEVAGERLKLAFEFDLFGQGANAGETTFHLQRASAEWGPLLFGYEKSLFMDPDLFPNIIDYWGPPGMIYVKNPGIRFAAINRENLYLGIGLELPGNDVDPGAVRIFDPILAANLTSSQKVPDLIVAGRVGGDWGHVRLAGIVRRVGFETLGSPGGEPDGHELGWGLNLTTALRPTSTTTIRLGGVYGRGIASYFNDGGTDLAPVLRQDLTVEASAAEIYGLMAYIDQQWTDQVSSSIGASRTRLNNTNFQTGDAFRTGDYASVNLLYKPLENLLVGGELLYGRREDRNGESGSDTRFQLSIRYSFAVPLLGGR